MGSIKAIKTFKLFSYYDYNSTDERRSRTDVKSWSCGESYPLMYVIHPRVVRVRVGFSFEVNFLYFIRKRNSDLLVEGKLPSSGEE